MPKNKTTVLLPWQERIQTPKATRKTHLTPLRIAQDASQQDIHASLLGFHANVLLADLPNNRSKDIVIHCTDAEEKILNSYTIGLHPSAKQDKAGNLRITGHQRQRNGEIVSFEQRLMGAFEQISMKNIDVTLDCKPTHAGNLARNRATMPAIPGYAAAY